MLFFFYCFSLFYVDFQSHSIYQRKQLKSPHDMSTNLIFDLTIFYAICGMFNFNQNCGEYIRGSDGKINGLSFGVY